MSRARTYARIAVACGVVAVLAVPAGVVVSRRSQSIDLVQALVVAVPVAFVVGVIGVAAGRKARYALARTLVDDARRLARVGRGLAWAGTYISVTGALALVFFEILRSRH